MFTTHGHHIPGTVLGNDRPPTVSRCGGPSRCRVCAWEALRALNAELDPQLENLIPPSTSKNEAIVSNDLALMEYVRKPFRVTGVQVTEKNMAAVANWCRGDIRETTRSRSKSRIKCVHVETIKASADWQKEARVGDWVLLSDVGFKIYTDRAFKDAFDPFGVISENGLELTKGDLFDDLVGHNCD